MALVCGRIPCTYELARRRFRHFKVNFLSRHGYTLRRVTALQKTKAQAMGDDTPPGNLPAGNVSSTIFTLDYQNDER